MNRLEPLVSDEAVKTAKDMCKQMQLIHTSGMVSPRTAHE